MDVHSQTIVRKYGFKSRWEIDENLINGNEEEISTKLEVVEGMPDVKWHLGCDNEFPVDFFFSIESKDKIEYSLKYKFLNSSTTSPEMSEYVSVGWQRFILYRISRETLQQNIKNGKVTFELEACFSYKDAKFNGFNECDAEWGLRLKESTSTDFNILVDGQIIGIHKLMVTAESPVFGRMFESGLKETREGKVTIHDFHHETIQAAMDYCYREDITEFLKDHQNSMELLRFCDKYDFQTLKPKLEKQIISSLSKENAFYIGSNAEAANAPDVRQSCLDFIRPLLINNCLDWPFVDMSEIDADFLKELVSGALNMNNGA